MAFKSLEKTLRREMGVDFPEKPHFPSFHVDNKQMPEIEDWIVGEEYEITIKIKQRSFEKFEGSNPTASFDILSYEVK